MLRWYLIHTKPAGEVVARSNLERQGYEVYLPRLVQPVRRRLQWHERIVALFPRYLFLHLSEGLQALGPVRSSIGVAGIVRFGAEYAIVPDRIVSELRSREEPQTGLHRAPRRPPLKPGTPVRITHGPFDGLEGICERHAGADRVVVLLKLLGQDAPVRIPADFVAASCAA